MFLILKQGKCFVLHKVKIEERKNTNWATDHSFHNIFVSDCGLNSRNIPFTEPIYMSGNEGLYHRSENGKMCKNGQRILSTEFYYSKELPSPQFYDELCPDCFPNDLEQK